MNVNVPEGLTVPTNGKPEISTYHSSTLAQGFWSILNVYVFAGAAGSAFAGGLALAGGWGGRLSPPAARPPPPPETAGPRAHTPAPGGIPLGQKISPHTPLGGGEIPPRKPPP